MTIESIETELLNELMAIDDHLNKDRVIYNEVRGALNTIKNKKVPLPQNKIQAIYRLQND